MKRDTNLARVAVLAVLILAVVTLAVITVSKYSRFRAQTAETADPSPAITTDNTRQAIEDQVLIYKGVRYVPRRGVESYLILGVDRTEAQIEANVVNGQADVLLLLVLDPQQSRYRVLQLNRDTVSLVNILSPDGSVSASMYKPLCLAYAYGAGVSGENTVNSVRWLLQDMPIDGYAAVSLEAIGALNDAVGGVTVRIESDMTAVDPSFVEGATVTLDTRTAERFVRARMSLGETNNQTRMGRQAQFMRVWLDTAKAKAAQDPQFAMRLLRRLEPLLMTDMSEKRLSSLATDAGKYEYEGILTIDGEYRVVDGFQYYYADEDSLMETIIELFYQAE